jgi:hypothetical protein
VVPQMRKISHFSLHEYVVLVTPLTLYNEARGACRNKNDESSKMDHPENAGNQKTKSGSTKRPTWRVIL